MTTYLSKEDKHKYRQQILTKLLNPLPTPYVTPQIRQRINEAIKKLEAARYYWECEEIVKKA